MDGKEGFLDEREAASIVAGLHASNDNVDGRAAAAASGAKKRSCAGADERRPRKKPSSGKCSRATPAAARRKDPPPIMDATGLVFARAELKPAPYFYYTDHSTERDDDPLTPMTAAGSVPTFPAKMHAILTNPQLADVVAWNPHGRSWRILKPRDFEIRVLPKYFEHSKFSSFVRQANGWGFRRMSSNAYYHEYFLRAMPWLCKKMRRPKVAEKKAVHPDMEPDLEAISAQFPVPDAPPTREVLVLQKTIEQGPKARMPVMWDTGTPPAAPASPAPAVENLTALNHAPCLGDMKPAALPTPSAMAAPASARQGTSLAPAPAMGVMNMERDVPALFARNSVSASTQENNLAADRRYAVAAPAATIYPPKNTAQTLPNSLASDSNFAAGFMAATAYHSHHIRNMLSSAFAVGMPIPNNGSIIMPSAQAAPAAPLPSTGDMGLGSALELLQRGVGQGDLLSRETPSLAAVSARHSNMPPPGTSLFAATAEAGGDNNLIRGSVGNNHTLSDQVIKRLQGFQESQFD